MRQNRLTRERSFWPRLTETADESMSKDEEALTVELKQLAKQTQNLLRDGELPLNLIPLDPALLEKLMALLPARDVTLGGVKVALTGDGAESALTITGEYAGVWEIPGGAGLSGMALTIVISGKKNLEFACEMTGRLTLGGQVVEVMGTAESEAWAFTLTDGSRIDLAALAKAIIPGATGLPALKLADLALQLSRLQLNMTGEKGVASAALVGQARFGGGTFDVTVELPGLAVTAISTAGSVIRLDDLVDALMPGAGEVAAAVMEPVPVMEPEADDAFPDLGFTDMHLTANIRQGTLSVNGRSTGTWTVPVGVRGVTVTDMTLDLHQDLGGAISGEFAGNIRLMGNEVAVRYAFPGELVMEGTIPAISLGAILGELIGPDRLRMLGVPAPILNAGLQDLTFRLAPLTSTCTAWAKAAGFENCGLVLRKSPQGIWEFGVALQTVPGYNLATLGPEFQPLASFRLPAAVLAYASADLGRLAIPGVAELDGEVPLAKGLNVAMVKGSRISLAEMAAQLFPGAADIPDVALTALVLNAKDQALTLAATVTDGFTVQVGPARLALTEILVQAERKDGFTRARLTAHSDIAGAPVLVEIALPAMTLAAFTPEGIEVSLTRAVHALLPGDGLIPQDVPDFTLTAVRVDADLRLKNLTFAAQSAGEWIIPVGITGVVIKDVNVKLVRAADGKVTGTISGKAVVGGHELAVQYDLPGELLLTGKMPKVELSAVVDQLCGLQEIASLPIPTGLLDVGLEAVMVTLSPLALRLAISAMAPGFDLCELVVLKGPEGWDFGAALLPAAGFKFSAILPELAPLDGLHLPEMALVASTFDLTGVPIPGLKIFGLNLVAGCGFHLALPKAHALRLPAIIQTIFGDAPAIPDLAVAEFDMQLVPAEKMLVIHAKALHDLVLPLGKGQLTVTGVELVVQHKDGKTEANLTGKAWLAGVVLRVTVALPSLVISATTPEGTAVNLTAVINALLPGEIALPSAVPNFTFTGIDLSADVKECSFEFKAESAATWELPVGALGIDLHDVSFTVKRTREAVTGQFDGMMTLGGSPFTVSYTIPGDLILTGKLPSVPFASLLGELAGPQAMAGIQVPPAIMNAALKDVLITVAPLAPSFVASAKLPGFDTVAIAVRRNQLAQWGCTGTLIPAATWTFSSIASELTPLDGLKFSDSALIFATADEKGFKVPDRPNCPTVDVVRGLTLAANLDLTGTEVSKLFHLSRIGVRAALALTSGLVELEGYLGGQLRITNDITFVGGMLRLALSRANVTAAVAGTMDVRLDKSPLTFAGTMAVNPNGATFAATMEGIWKEPFDARGIQISDVGIEVGMSLEGVPTVGLAGKAAVGEVDGHAAIRFDSANPSACMLAVGIDDVSLLQLMETVCHPALKGKIPADVMQTVASMRFKKADLYVVPQATRIGELKFDKGITVEGDFEVLDFDAKARAKVDDTTGIAVHAEIDPIKLGEIFTVEGGGGQPKPGIDVEIRPDQLPTVDIKGLVSLLGISREAVIKVSDKGILFLVDGKIFGLFESSVEGQAAKLSELRGFKVKAAMKNDLFALIKEQGGAELKRLADAATGKLTAAQKAVDAAQAEVDKLNGQIDAMRKTITAERAAAKEKLAAAQRAVEVAQAEVNKLNGQVDAMRRTIAGEREAAQRSLNAAKQGVQAAQAKVNSLNSQVDAMRRTVEGERAGAQRKLREAQAAVDSASRNVDSIKREMDKTEDWYDGLRWYKKGAYSAYYAGKMASLGTAWASAKGVLEAAKLTLEGVKRSINLAPVDLDPRVAGLLAARETAKAALAVAQETLKAAQAGIAVIPVEADPRIVGLLAARETASLALKAAQETLEKIKQGITLVPVDADPRIVGLFAALATATASLQAAKLALEGVKASVGGLASVATYVAQYGPLAVIDVRSASFEGDLTSVKDGKVSLALEVAFLGKTVPARVDFDFRNPLESVKKLVTSLLPK